MIVWEGLQRESALLQLKLNNCDSIQVPPPPYLTAVLKIHAEVWLYDHGHDCVAADFAGFRTADWYADHIPSMALISKDRKAPYVRECRQAVRDLVKDALSKAGRSYPPPHVFECNMRMGTRISAKKVVILKIPAWPLSGEPPPPDGNGGDHGAPTGSKGGA